MNRHRLWAGIVLWVVAAVFTATALAIPMAVVGSLLILMSCAETEVGRKNP